MLIEIEKISQKNGERIDYNAVIFKLEPADKTDCENTGVLAAVLHSLIIGGALKILINMNKLDVIDSSVIGFFIGFTKAIRKNGGDIIFCNVSKEIERILSVVNLQKFLKLYKTEVEAINSFRYLK